MRVVTTTFETRGLLLKVRVSVLTPLLSVVVVISELSGAVVVVLAVSAALPFVFGAVGMVLLGRHSDRAMERKGHVAVALLMAGVGIGLSGLVSSPVVIMALLCFAQIGVSAVPPMFWPLPASFLTGASAAAGIAAINSLGNLSGFAGPYAMGYLKDLTGTFTAGLLLLAGCAVVGAAVVMILRIDVRREQAAGEVALAH